MWKSLGENLKELKIQFGAVDCEIEVDACAKRKIAPAAPDAKPAPVLKFWTGSTFRRYSGQFKLRALQEYAASKIAQLTDEQKNMLGLRQQNNQARDQSAGQASPKQNLPPAEMLQLRVTLLAITALSFVSWLLVKWLSLPHLEQPASMLLVGSRAQSTERVPSDGKGDGFYVFRMTPPSGEMTPVGTLAVLAPNIACMRRARVRASASRGHLIHVACESNVDSTHGKGGVASFRFNPAASPCLEELGGSELSCGLTCSICSLDARRAKVGEPRPQERYVSTSYGGLLAVLKPALTEPHWRSPSTWRSPPTGALELEFSFRPGADSKSPTVLRASSASTTISVLTAQS